MAITRNPSHAVGTESVAATIDSKTPSVSNWRTKRPRRAPSAVRTASSRSRAAVLAITRFETLAVAIAINRAIDNMKSATRDCQGEDDEG